ncbi:IS30 family transposase [Pseudonocardia sp. KRD-184]|uniref:IS30 family transposase n=1 Tax=Pseudonocardia oceani TaxID=2792013 RepID=A0ABS6U3A2_9PSEU|nr:IS30 family transposase [Pseudonocardia oceani]MBW0092297.1 IS30 family transposase [Pseudonocardia oceani]MBW0099305.1 IS30 family transposase [Pseudonocardia oceani]MBW0125428.1 IS30 family transposase [Pseudonocardia oceani]MBW0126476.1 IS30 family transposase [Pseudonocardia oceani]
MVRRQQSADRAVRPKLRSPGHPKYQRHVETAFWAEIAKGLRAEQAAAVIGVAPAVATRWYRQAGGMRPFVPRLPSGQYLSFPEREEIALLNAQGRGVREIARDVGRDPGTISRELRRNAATRGGRLDYRASVAQWKADLAARRPKTAKLVVNPLLHAYVQERLSGQISTPDGETIAGPEIGRWTGRNKPHRQDRAWVQAWSPEQIANRISVDFPDDESMRISHEAIYQALYIQDRGALKRELILCLRTGRALRAPRARSRRKTWAHVTPEALISERPAEVEDRAVPGHWEGDLIIGLERSAIGTVVERSTRFTMLIHLPREEGYRHKHTIKNGPALAGYGAITMKNALTTAMSTLPQQLARSLTWDRGKEMSAHLQFKVETGIPVFFADPHSPWQCGTNENTNGLLRQYFPKGTDLSRWSTEEVEAVAHALNTRPRKTLGWKTPAEAFAEQLRSAQQAGVATTG